jgi:hypothetical protein
MAWNCATAGLGVCSGFCMVSVIEYLILSSGYGRRYALIYIESGTKEIIMEK